MTAHCGEADAYFDDKVVLEQHQMTMDIVRDLVCANTQDDIWWLDVGCGRGQMLTVLASRCPQEVQQRIVYCAFDECGNFVNEVIGYIKKIGLENYNIEKCTVSQFVYAAEEYVAKNIYCNDISIVTAINMIHELSPEIIPGLFLSVFDQLKITGILFLYDNAELLDREENAITYRLAEIEEILQPIDEIMFKSHKFEEDPDYPSWGIIGCNRGWDFRNVSQAKRIQKRTEITRKVRDILMIKLTESMEQLRLREKHYPESVSEADAKRDCVYRIACLQRMLGETK